MGPRRLATLLAACAALTGAVIAGCGGDSGGDVDPGPAAAVPEDAPIYVDATVKPDGSTKTDANAALGKVLDTDDPGSKIVSLIDQEAAKQPANEQFTYAADIEPWLGDQIGFFFTSLGEDEQGAAVIETTNPDAALAFAQKSESGATPTSDQAGTTIYTNPADGDSFATVGDFLVAGTESGVKAAIDANNGGSLGDSSDFTDTVGELPDNRLGTVYTVPKNLLAAIPADRLGNSQTFFNTASGENLDKPIAGSLSATANSFDLEFKGEANGVQTPESSLLGDVPAGAWLALGLGDLGDNLKQTVDQLKSSGVPNVQAVISQIETTTGASLDELTAALGDAVLYVQGTTQQTLSGALVVHVNDTELTGRLLDQLRGLLALSGTTGVKPLTLSGGGTGLRITDPSNFPQPVELAQVGDKFVIGYGAGSAQAAVQPGQTLSSSPSFTSAEGQISSLGADLFLSFPPIFQLAESSGSSQDPSYQQAKPYIDALDYLVSGSGDSDGKLEAKAVLGLK